MTAAAIEDAEALATLTKKQPQTAQEKADAGLSRRGNAGLQKDVEQARRIYDPVVEKEWGLKYRNFSSDHMRRAYRTYAEARHDPFNKSPAWLMSIIRKIGKDMQSQGITAQQEFAKLDISGDGLLERAEVRRLLLSVVPDLGDLELAAIFEVLDEDHSGEVSLEELTHLFFGKNGTGSKWTSKPLPGARSPRPGDTDQAAQDAAGGQHRTPVHRVKRIPPAQVEGWDHLHRDPKHKMESELLKERDNGMFKRIGGTLCLSPRMHSQMPASVAKYENFGGGGDTAKFHRQQWRKSVRDGEKGGSAASEIPSIPDPGGMDIKPGYHIELARLCPQYAMTSARRSAR